MHFFGTMGVLSFFIGTFLAIWLIGVKLYDISMGIPLKRDVNDQPLFYIALVAIILGSQLFLTGFVAELVSRSAPERNNYLIEKEIL